MQWQFNSDDWKLQIVEIYLIEKILFNPTSFSGNKLSKLFSQFVEILKLNSNHLSHYSIIQIAKLQSILCCDWNANTKLSLLYSKGWLF
jgi:hypothetical protein